MKNLLYLLIGGVAGVAATLLIQDAWMPENPLPVSVEITPAEVAPAEVALAEVALAEDLQKDGLDITQMGLSSLQAGIYMPAYEDLVGPLAELQTDNPVIYYQYIEALSWQDMPQIEELIGESPELRRYKALSDAILKERDTQLLAARAVYDAHLAELADMLE